MTTTKLTFATRTTTEDGRTFERGSSGDVPAAEARSLVHRGRARLDDGTNAERPAKKAASSRSSRSKKKAESAPPKSDTDTQSDANSGDGKNAEGDQS